MVIKALRETKELQPYLKKECIEKKSPENGAKRDSIIKFSDKINLCALLVVKVDDYYNDLHLANTPASIDCLIVYELEGKTKLYLLEQKEPKNHNRLKSNLKNLSEKFKNTTEKFMKNDFKSIFVSEISQISTFEAFLVSSVNKKLSDEIKKKGLTGLGSEYSLSLKPLRFNSFVKYIIKAHPDDFVNIIK